MNIIKISAAAFLAIGLSLTPAYKPAWAADQTRISENALSHADEAILAYIHEISIPAAHISMKAPEGAFATDAARALAREFMEVQGLKEGRNPQTAVCTAVGACSIPLHKNNPDFFLERTTAFKAAFKESLYLLAKQIETEKRARIAAELAYPVQKQSAEVQIPSLDQLAVHAAGLEGNISYLKNLNIDERKWSRMSPTVKQATVRDALARHIACLTIRSLCGAIPVQNFWGTDDADNQSVAVISVYSPELARAIHKLSAAPQKMPAGNLASAVVSLLPMNEPERMANLTGSRILRLNGQYMAIAFGQWLQPYTGQEADIAEKYRTLSQQQADSAAKEMLKEFLGTITPPTDHELESILAADIFEEEKHEINTEIIVDAYLTQMRSIAAHLDISGKNMAHWSSDGNLNQDVTGSVAFTSLFAEKSENTSPLPGIRISFSAAQNDFSLDGARVNGMAISNQITRSVTSALEQSKKFTILREEKHAKNTPPSLNEAVQELPVESVSAGGSTYYKHSMDGIAENGFTLSPPEGYENHSSQLPDATTSQALEPLNTHENSENNTFSPNSYILQGAVTLTSYEGAPRISSLTGGVLTSQKTELHLACEIKSTHTDEPIWNFSMDRPVDMHSCEEGTMLLELLDSIGKDLAIATIEALNPARITEVNGDIVRLDIGNGLYAKGEKLSVYEKQNDAMNKASASIPMHYGPFVGTLEITETANDTTTASYSGKKTLSPGMPCRSPQSRTVKNQHPNANDSGIVILEDGGVLLPFD